MLEPHRDGMRERKINLQLPSRTSSLLQDCASLAGTFGFNCGIRAEPPLKFNEGSAVLVALEKQDGNLNYIAMKNGVSKSPRA
jgi:hypothetical protein